MLRLRYLLAVTCVLVAAAVLYLAGYQVPPVDPAWERAVPERIPAGAVTVRFSGTSTLLFSDGSTQWMVDGWFTRPGPLQTLFGEIAPDPEAITYGLARNSADTLAAVIPAHSHYDHAMDAPEVARRTGARVIGSEATANIARGWGLPEAQIQVVSDGEAVRLGEFRVTFIESRHFQFTDPELVATLLEDSDIPRPLVPPASVYDYKLGKAWVLHVEHPRASFMVIGSAGFVPGLLEPYDVDVLFLGIGALGSQSADYREAYWRHTVEAVTPGEVVFIHWDSLTAPLDGPLVGEVRAAALIAGGSDDTLAFLKSRERTQPGPVFRTLPRFVAVPLVSAGGS